MAPQLVSNLQSLDGSVTEYSDCTGQFFTLRYLVQRSGDRIPVGVGSRFSTPVQTGSGAHPASYTMGTGSFPGVKRPGRGIDHPPPSSAEVKERVELYLYSPYRSSWPVTGGTLLIYLITYLLTYLLTYSMEQSPS